MLPKEDEANKLDDEGLMYYNELANYIWKTQAQYHCPFCHRGFIHAQYLKHAGGQYMNYSLARSHFWYLWLSLFR